MIMVAGVVFMGDKDNTVSICPTAADMNLRGGGTINQDLGTDGKDNATGVVCLFHMALGHIGMGYTIKSVELKHAEMRNI